MRQPIINLVHPILPPRSHDGDTSTRGQNHERKYLSSTQTMLIYLAVLGGLSSRITKAAARDMQYCSELNTAENDETQSNFQSNGLCYDQCKGSYAFAIVKGKSCWCSNYAPETSGSGCDESCPGYPSENCGNTEKSLYGYMSLELSPSGTKGASTKSTTTTQNLDTSRTTNSKTRNAVSPDQSSPSSLNTRITVVTKIDGYKTITISPTSTNDSVNTAITALPNNGTLLSNTGRFVGLIVGLLSLLLAIIGGIIYWRRRRNQYHEALYSQTASPNSTVAGPTDRRRSRSLSTLGLIGEKGIPTINTSTDPQNTANSTSAPNNAQITSGSKAGQVFDQRLDPGQLFMRFDRETGSSRMSVRSLRDDTDYSRRVLRLANPDI